MSEQPNTIETKKQELFGRNVEIRARFLRHGSKDPETGRLTEEGASASQEYGGQLTPSAEGDKYILKGYTSEVERAQETTNAIIEKVNTNRKGRARVRLELGEKETDAEMSTDALSLPYSKYIKQSRREEKIRGKTISLHQLAQRVAGQIDHFIKMSKRLKSDSRADLINITHFPWLAAFIKEAFGQEIEKEKNQAKRKEIENKITDLGSLDGFELIIKRDGDNVGLFLKIGASEFVLTEEVIKKILES